MLVLKLFYSPDAPSLLGLQAQHLQSVAGGGAMGDTSLASLNGVQVLIDSTGRANDLYRRVEVRLEPADNAFAYPFYAVQVGEALEKDLTVTSEWDFLD